MEQVIVILSGVLSGLVMWVPFGIGISAHRHAVAGIPIQSTNSLVIAAAGRPGNYSALGRVIFVLIMLVWVCIFFSAIFLPVFVAKLLGVPENSEIIGYGISANLFMTIVGFIFGKFIWRRVAYNA